MQEWRAVEKSPPGDRVAAAIAGSVRAWWSRYEATIGVNRGRDRRRESLVEHRVSLAAGDAAGEIARLDRTGRPPAYDAVDHEFRVATTLRIPWSWPPVPVWLAVGELSANRSALRLRLRNRRRLRYPLRYYDRAHALLDALESRLTPASTRSVQ